MLTCPIASPPVVAFDSDGNVVASWGNPALIPAPLPNYGAAAYMPHGAHGCYVDYEGNIWSAETATASSRNTRPTAAAGFTRCAAAIPPAAVFPTCNEVHSFNSSHTLLNEPADIAVDPKIGPISRQRGDIYIADGYGNHRVVVFDRNGNYLTQFGTNCGSVSPNCPGGTFGATGGGHPHCVVLGNDDLRLRSARQPDRGVHQDRNVHQVDPDHIVPGCGSGQAGRDPACRHPRVRHRLLSPTCSSCCV